LLGIVVDGATVADGAIVVDGAWESGLDMDIHTTVVIMGTLITAVIMLLVLQELQDVLKVAQDAPQDKQDATGMKLALNGVAQKNWQEEEQLTNKKRIIYE
jgi:flagellar motor component MotA